MKLFEEFGEVKVREEIPTLKSDLEKILNVEEIIIKKYEKSKKLKFQEENKAYHSFYEIVKKKLGDIMLTQELLQAYIDARENTKENTAAIIRGMYSSVLLEIISTKTPEKTTVIDGRGKTFNYLFYSIHTVKNVRLSNIKGENIFALAGSLKGNVKYITIDQIEGDDLFALAGSDEGNIEYITLNRIKGFLTLASAGKKRGKVEHIVLNDIEGLWTQHNFCKDHGSGTYITLNKLNGNETLINAGTEKGSINYLLLNEINGARTLKNVGCHGNAQHIFLNKINGNETLLNAGLYGNVNNIIQEETNKNQKEILAKIILIAETMYSLSLEEQKAAHDEIAKLQEEIFPGET